MPGTCKHFCRVWLTWVYSARLVKAHWHVWSVLKSAIDCQQVYLKSLPPWQWQDQMQLLSQKSSEQTVHVLLINFPNLLDWASTLLTASRIQCQAECWLSSWHRHPWTGKWESHKGTAQMPSLPFTCNEFPGQSSALQLSLQAAVSVMMAVPETCLWLVEWCFSTCLAELLAQALNLTLKTESEHTNFFSVCSIGRDLQAFRLSWNIFGGITFGDASLNREIEVSRML